MPIIDLSFPHPLNVSVQVGDTAYFHEIQTVGQANTAGQTYTHNEASSTTTQLGNIIRIFPWNRTISTIQVDVPVGVSLPNSNDFILFSKDNRVNLSSILGYYAEVEFKNNSWLPDQELFSVGCEFNESSK